jgi:hypothetical protein
MPAAGCDEHVRDIPACANKTELRFLSPKYGRNPQYWVDPLYARD